MRTLYRPTADPVAQTQIFIVVHAPAVLTVIGDEALQLFPQLRRLGPQALQTCDDLLHLAGTQVLGDLMDPAAGPLRFLPVEQAGHAPGMLQGVPKVEDFAAAHKQGARFQIHSAPSPTITTTVWG